MQFYVTIGLLMQLCVPAPVACTLFPVDRVYPLLSSGGARVDWTSGGGSSLLAGFPIVRVNVRGIRLLRGAMRSLGELGWTSVACNVSASAMCTSEIGVVFPPSADTLVTPGNPRSLPKGWQDSGCSHAQGRVVLPVARYDIGACDVLDEGVDLVYHGGILHRLKSSVSAVEYWAMVGLSVILVRSLSKNVRQSMSGEDATPLQDLPLAACAACLIVAAHAGSAIYVTSEDLVFYCTTMAYTACYMVYHLGFWILDRSRTPPIYNMTAGSFQLVASRLYCGAETPYNPIVAFVVSARTFSKLRAPGFYNVVTGFLDAFYLSIACDAGFPWDHGYLVPLFACAYMASEKMFPPRAVGSMK